VRGAIINPRPPNRPDSHRGADDLAGPIALLDRAPHAVLFRGAQGDITAATFLRDAARCAALLHDTGHVVNCCTNRYWFAVGFAAALLRGQVTLLTGDPASAALHALAGRFGPLQVISDNADFATPLPHALIGPGEAAPPAAMPHIDAARPALVAFTSGSTGEPVGTAKRFGELVARSRAAAARFGFAGSEAATIIATVPPHHMYGFETSVVLPWHAGVAAWCDPVFYPADLQGALQAGTERAVLVTTPLQLRGMLAMAPAPRLPVMVISATAPLDRELARQAEQAWNTRVMEIFGATEVGSIASRRTVADADWTLYPGVSMSDQNGAVVRAPGAEARALNDVVELLDGGARFRLLGRCGDMVKLGGRRASLAGLTRVLTSVPGVADGVFLAPDDLETRATARLLALAVAPGLSGAQVVESLRGQIDPLFMPRPLLCVPALPRNALGKLPRQALLALVAQHTRRRGVSG
jgi:acyl-coenzyme A synthetase/AMP-(fatty) acid ligase